MEDVHDVGTGKRRKLGIRQYMEKETVTAGAQAQVGRDVERYALRMAEQAEEGETDKVRVQAQVWRNVERHSRGMAEQAEERLKELELELEW